MMNNKKIFALSLIICLCLGVQSVLAQYKAYPIDPFHSKIGFDVTFAGMTKVEGRFADFHGTVFYDEADISKLSATVIIKTESIDTDVDFRDKHLRRADFFDAEKHPNLIFKSQKTIKKGSDYFMVGELTMKGVTKNVEVKVKRVQKLQPDPWNNSRATFQGSLTLNRYDFGIGEKGEFFDQSISEEVNIDLIISFRILHSKRMTILNRSPVKELYDVIATQGPEKGIEYIEANKSDFESKKISFERIAPQISTRLLENNKSETAIKVYQSLIKNAPKAKHWMYSSLANVHFINSQYKEAQVQAQKALELNKEDHLATEILKALKK